MKDKRYAIGIDIGGSFIKYGICSEEGQLVAQDMEETPAEEPPETILKLLTKMVENSLDIAKEKGIKIGAIGVGTPGSVDVERGFLMGSTPNFKKWKDVGISDYLENQFNLPVFADNDANLMAFGEFSFGTGKEKSCVVCVTLGTGIGGGIIIDGEIFRGSFYSGAEIGHMTIDFNGRPCNCGGTGCWEQYGSATAMVKDYNKIKGESPINGTRELFERYSKGEKAAQRVLEQSIEFLGSGLANIINVFNPEMIIVGGGVSEAGEWFIKKITESAHKRAMETSRRDVEIKAAKLGNQAGMLGAAALALKMAKD